MSLKRKQAFCTDLLLLDDKAEVAKKKRARWSIWVKPLLQKRAELEIYSNLFPELLQAKSLRDYIRMDKMHIDYLVERLYPYLIKQDTIMRESIKPREQCCLFLRYVASRETFSHLSKIFKGKFVSGLVLRNVICWKCSQLEWNTSFFPTPGDLVTFSTCLSRLSCVKRTFHLLFMSSSVKFSSNSSHNFWINARRIFWSLYSIIPWFHSSGFVW